MLEIDGLTEAEAIGSGGFADVYRAHELAHGREVAVKVLRTTSDTEAMLRLFERERTAMGRLGEHDGIVSVYRSGVTTDGSPYLVMPLYDCSLADMLDESPLQPAEAMRMMKLVSEAVQFAHDNNVVHRDLKPANILMSSRGQPAVADFGVAKLVTTGRTLNSMSLRLTPEYSSPGVIMGRPVSPSDDVYSLGATLFSCLTARPPFAASTPEEANVYATMRRIVEDEVEDLRALGFESELCDIVENAMSKDPDKRYRSAAEFGLALEIHGGPFNEPAIASSVRRRVGNTSPTRRFADPSPTMDPPDLQPSTGHTEVSRGRKRRGAVAALALASTTLVAAVLAVVDLSDSPSAESIANPRAPAVSSSAATSTPQGRPDATVQSASLIESSSASSTSITPTSADESRGDGVPTPTTRAVSSTTATPSTLTPTTRIPATSTSVATSTVATEVETSTTTEEVFATTSTTTTTIAMVVVVGVAGVTGEQAVLRLAQSNLEASCDIRCADIVVATSPPAGTELPRGSTVELRF